MNLLTYCLVHACRRSQRIYNHVNFAVTVQRSGRRLTIPVRDGCGLNALDFEDDSIQAVIRLLYQQGRRGCFVDVGANLGLMLLNLLVTAPELAYLGFEPDLTAAHYISELIRLNPHPHYQVLATALGCPHRMAALYSEGPADASATFGLELRPPQMYPYKHVAIVCRGDDVLSSLLEGQPIFLLKLDVEGLEFEVLEGLRETLASQRPPVFFEVMGYGHLLDGTYRRDYFGGELSPHEIARLVKNRKANMARLKTLLTTNGYALIRCSGASQLLRVSTLDPGPSLDSGEMNFLGVPEKDLCSLALA